MQITITMDLTAENLDKLKSLIPSKEVPGQITFDSLSEIPAEQPNPETVSEKITKTDIRAAALKLSKAGKQKELAAAFAKFGGKKLSDFDSRPEEYPNLMKELVSIHD